MKNSNDLCQMPLSLQVAEVQITYRNKLPVAERQKINGSSDAEKLLRANWGDNMELVEKFNVLFLSKSNPVKWFFRLSLGVIT